MGNASKVVHGIRQNKDIASIVLATAVILLIPLVAMQFSDEVVWTFFDFVAIGTLLLGTGFAFVWLSRRVRTTNSRVIIGISLLVVLVLIWIELAVGIFD